MHKSAKANAVIAPHSGEVRRRTTQQQPPTSGKRDNVKQGGILYKRREGNRIHTHVILYDANTVRTTHVFLPGFCTTQCEEASVGSRDLATVACQEEEEQEGLPLLVYALCVQYYNRASIIMYVVRSYTETCGVHLSNHCLSVVPSRAVSF